MMKTIRDFLGTAPAVRTNELRCYLRCMKSGGFLPERKFVIFAHYRTGSTLLQSLLNSHPAVWCERELFLDFVQVRFKKVLFPYQYVKANLRGSSMDVGGFVLRLSQLERILTPLHGTPEDFLRRLDTEGWKIIHLRRENHLRQAMSNVAGILRGQSHISVERPMEKTNVRVDPGDLIKTIHWMESVSEKEDRLMRRFEHLTVVYEQDLLDAGKHQETADRIFNYLGLDSSPVRSKYKRISSDDLFGPIVNAAEIEELIRNSRYSAYL